MMNYNKTEAEQLDQFLCLFYALTIGEIVLLVISFIVFSTLVYIMIEVPLLHKNFIRLHNCLYIEFCSFSLARFIKLILALSQNLESNGDLNFIEQGPLALMKSGFIGWLEFVRLAFGFLAGGCMAVCLMERVLATIMLKTYETLSNNGISIFFIIAHILGSILVFIIYSSGLIPSPIEASCIIAAILLGLITLYLLKYYNLRQYKQSKLKNTHYTLSEKFQISENIRSLTVLWRNFLGAVVFISIISCLFILTTLVNDALFKEITFYSFNLMIPLFITLNSSIFIMTTRDWRRSLNNKLLWVKNNICSSKISTDDDLKLKNERLNNLRTLDGQRMIFAIDKEGELYFQKLEQDWA